MTIIEEEDFLVGLALLTHDSGTYLTKTDTMPPTLAVKDKATIVLLHIECGTEQMTLAEGATDLKFLANGECLFRTYNLQFPDTSAFTTL